MSYTFAIETEQGQRYETRGTNIIPDIPIGHRVTGYWVNDRWTTSDFVIEGEHTVIGLAAIRRAMASTPSIRA